MSRPGKPMAAIMTSTPTRSIPATEVQERFGYYQDEAIRAPVVISKDGRPETVLLSYEEFLRLRKRDRRAYATNELPPDIAAAILDAQVPDALDDIGSSDRPEP